MNFIKVTAIQCNPQGLTSSHKIRSEFHLSVNLIAAIRGTEVLLNGSKIINLNGDYFTEFKLAQGVQIP